MLRIDPKPLFELSPWLYLQFMEPLGVTDGSVEASWDHMKNRWRPDLIEATKELAPPMMRWGGLFSAYYHWRQGMGPRPARKPMQNLVWGGMESNQVGTAEFVDFCQQVKADALMCVNFESEGDPQWATNPLGESRAGNAQEAAEWVDYCNNPENKERIAHGFKKPLPIKVWQLGNETSYGPRRFQRDAAIAKTIEFSKAMRKADPSIKLIAWGDSGWAPTMLEGAGEHVDYLAFHNLFDPGHPLSDEEFRKDPAATWSTLMDSVKQQEKKIREMRQQVEGRKFPLALTECHFTMRGRNRCDLNSAWAVGVAYARFMNLHERHGDLLKIANIGDFCGTRWQTNVIMLPTPGGKAYIMPVGKVAALYRKHSGRDFVKVSGGTNDLDVTASRTGDTYFLHVVNTNRTHSQTVRLTLDGVVARSLKSFQISADPEAEIMSAEKDPMKVKEQTHVVGEAITFPAASVTAVEVDAGA
ncbi:MAG: Intracellular exo-alpha-(1-_5)-L-arabinofuranosidase [Verrucomicrobiales bacterium]|nr:Intracellular exo-alpha-(1->5)-L-arabinofuranosidase [Verrucomicrobiales bacterium]